MSPLQNVRHDVHNERFRTAVFLGAASIPLTIGANWLLRPETLSGTALFVACVISGYLANSQSIDPARAGAVTGAIGGIPLVLWETGATVVEWWRHPTIIDAAGNPWLLAAVSAGAGASTTVILAVVLLIVGRIGGFIGGWLNDRIDITRHFGSAT